MAENIGLNVFYHTLVSLSQMRLSKIDRTALAGVAQLVEVLYNPQAKNDFYILKALYFLFFTSSSEDTLTDFRERERDGKGGRRGEREKEGERKREREREENISMKKKHQLASSHTCLSQRSILQTRSVLLLGIEPTTFWC